VSISVLWAGEHADLVIAAGREGVVCLGTADGRRLWEYDAPQRWSGRPSPLLSAFRLVGGRLYFLQGQRRLFCLDAETGDVLWTRWAPGAVLRPPDISEQFSDDYQASERTVALPGVGWLLDARPGRPLHAIHRDPLDTVWE